MRRSTSLERVDLLLQEFAPELKISKQKLRQAEAVSMVRSRREAGEQNLGFASRPFVLCGLPVKRPSRGALVHERRNGRFMLQVTGHPEHGLPWGQDRLVPIFLATLAIRTQSPTIEFSSAAEMLDAFGLQQGGAQYRRLTGAFQRIFGATIYFGTDVQRDRARVFHQSRFNFMREARLWYARDMAQPTLPGECRNTVELSAEFFREIMDHPIPTDLQAAKALSCAPAALDLFTWLTYRCFVAKGEERIPLFGDFGLANQLGTLEYTRPRKFREKLEGWLRLVYAMWPECPAHISVCGRELVVSAGTSILTTSKCHLEQCRQAVAPVTSQLTPLCV
ncbi:MAG: replication initiator protein A [Bryobacteraceae bacterium]|nr:replication initiator protein A [Bryobacteraceae bacterium]